MAILWRLLRPEFSVIRVHQVSDLHLKYALRHTMCGGMADIQSVMAEIRRGKKDEDATGHKYDGLPYSTGRS